MNSIEHSILKNLISNEDYTRKVLPFLKEEYFEDETQKVIFQECREFISKYDSRISYEALSVGVQNRTDLTERDYTEISQLVDRLRSDEEDQQLQWLLDVTENWCRDRAIYLALMDSIYIADGKDSKRDRGAIPSILTDALSVSFDNHIGHDYIEDYAERFESYHRKEDRIPFDLGYFNKITKGGLPNKTLNVALAGTGVGKSLFMCHMASACLVDGYDVLYITMEMAEEKIAERIDANLLDVNIQDIVEIPQQIFEKKIDKLAQKTRGHLIIKEYPTASAHVGHFRALLNELALKKSFRPSIIFIDYLNICASNRYSKMGNVNSYSYIKAIAEELRGLAVEANVPIVSATQTTRSGYNSSDVELTDTSESFGLPATADLMFALISTEELESLGQIMVKQLKNRYNDLNVYKRFTVGVDRAKMRLYDCDQSEGGGLIDAGDEITSTLNDTKSKFASLNFS
jgi:replicative DNA helicase